MWFAWRRFGSGRVIHRSMQDEVRVVNATSEQQVKPPKVGHILRQVRIEFLEGIPAEPIKIQVKPQNGPSKTFRLHRDINTLFLNLNLVTASEAPTIDLGSKPAILRFYYRFVGCPARDQLKGLPAWLPS